MVHEDSDDSSSDSTDADSSRLSSGESLRRRVTSDPAYILYSRAMQRLKAITALSAFRSAIDILSSSSSTSDYLDELVVQCDEEEAAVTMETGGYYGDDECDEDFDSENDYYVIDEETGSSEEDNPDGIQCITDITISFCVCHWFWNRLLFYFIII